MGRDVAESIDIINIVLYLHCSTCPISFTIGPLHPRVSTNTPVQVLINRQTK
jgi:hypothetical protein